MREGNEGRAKEGANAQERMPPPISYHRSGHGFNWNTRQGSDFTRFGSSDSILLRILLRVYYVFLSPFY